MTRRDLVVYAAGGGMRGIFGAGALHALAETGARDHVAALYGISSGAFNVARFALGSMTKAMEWYLHHVPEHRIVVHPASVALLRGDDVVDVSEAARVLEAEHLVDAETLASCPIPVSFGVVQRDTLTFHWLDARRADVIRLLLASSTIFPLVREAVIIDGTPYIDGGYREAVCYRRLRGEHPDQRLLLVLNDNEDESVVRRVAVGVALRLRDVELAEVWLDTMDRTPVELGKALDDPQTLVIRPDTHFPVHFATTDRAVLAHGFWLGYEAVLKQRDRLWRFVAG